MTQSSLPVQLLSLAANQPNPLEFLEKCDQVLEKMLKLMVVEEHVKSRQFEQLHRVEDKESKEQIQQLEMLNRTQAERIQELECLQNPYSNDGDAICNFEF
ncbi:MAG: hypothetical protein WAN66_13760 [Limnoraphis robusta]|uniref:Uncharacterized protein n=1 Tax=Limnoraphis robusta CS-951 TaxID=1637645 RepID=A0A0F5YGM5_9CYAN|nr:hypothetical protein [Limnoraphis robusta]KKD38034.1 hypothetical protein WN50_11030 [Limnoraphis robusta CS-951]